MNALGSILRDKFWMDSILKRLYFDWDWNSSDLVYGVCEHSRNIITKLRFTLYNNPFVERYYFKT